MTHPAYLYNLFFKITKPKLQGLISELEVEVVKWTGITANVHSMGGIAFKFNKKEIGHVHWNGDLDIVFGSNLTEKLLKIQGIQQHRFVPDVAITFPLHHHDDLIFAMELLRFSYILELNKIKDGKPDVEDFIADEVMKLPYTLSNLLKMNLKANF